MHRQKYNGHISINHGSGNQNIILLIDPLYKTNREKKTHKCPTIEAKIIFVPNGRHVKPF